MKVAGTWRPAVSPAVRVSGTWRPIQSAWVRVAGVWKQVFVAMTVSISNGSGGGLHGTLVSGGMSAPSITGGTSPYTYSWSFVSGQSVTLTNPTNSSLTCTWTPGSAGSFTTVLRCTVTDNNGIVVVSNNANLVWTIS